MSGRGVEGGDAAVIRQSDRGRQASTVGPGGLAANPTLPSTRVAVLTRDAHDEVRAAVVARRDLDPALRESIPAE